MNPIDKSYPTDKPEYFWIKVSFDVIPEGFCCWNGGGLNGCGKKFEEDDIAAVWEIANGIIICAPCAIKQGTYGIPPLELGFHYAEQAVKIPKKDYIPAKEGAYNASGWRIAPYDVACKYKNNENCHQVVKKDEIYLARLNKYTSCAACAASIAGSPVWVPTLADFGVEAESEVKMIKTGDPTAIEGWVWVNTAEPNLLVGHCIIGCKCWSSAGGCGQQIKPGDVCAQKGLGSTNILCPTCSTAKGHGIGGSGLIKAVKAKRQKKPIMICIKCGVRLCEACGECETKGCKLVGKAICTPEALAKVKHLLAETQKVRGYIALAETLKVPQPYRVVTDKADIESLSLQRKSFVRPCPIRPRHGFVESRLVDADLVSSPTDVIEAIFDEAKAADPQAELLIVPYVDSAYNMVITPTRLAIGAGNDGATAGKGSITVPLMGEPFSEISQKLYDQASVDTRTEDPYFEAVADDGYKVSFTQLRAGVKIPPAVGDDYIPKDMIVEEVIDASGDLLEWESQVKRIKSGTVVCHVGGTLTSHYGVHCLYNNIPVLTSHRPSVGDFLQTKEKGAAPDPEAIKRGLSVGITIPLRQDPRYVSDGEISARDAIKVLLVALHNAGAMGEKDGFWIGFAAAIMQRVGMAASHGEARHKNIPKTGKVARPAVYKVALADFFASRETLGAAQWSFQNLAWSSGYGGPKWAKCTEATIELDSSIREFLNDPSELQVGRLITKLNNAVNQAHNGGWWLNKFVGAELFDLAAAQSINLIAQAGIGMFRVANCKFDDLTGSVERWRVAPPIVVAKGEILAYSKKDGSHADNGMPTCVECGKEYPQFITYVAAVADGLSCDGCFASIKFKLNGEWIEVESPEEGDNSSDDNCNCPICKPQYHENEEDDDYPSDPPEPPEITKNTNVGNFIKILPEHVIEAAQVKYLKGGFLHLQVKTDASMPGYYSFDFIVKSANPQKMEPYAQEWSWSGSESHEYVPLKFYGSSEQCNFINVDAGLDFNYSILTGSIKDNIYESQKEIQAKQGFEASKIGPEETPF